MSNSTPSFHKYCRSYISIKPPASSPKQTAHFHSACSSSSSFSAVSPRMLLQVEFWLGAALALGCCGCCPSNTHSDKITFSLLKGTSVNCIALTTFHCLAPLVFICSGRRLDVTDVWKGNCSNLQTQF